MQDALSNIAYNFLVCLLGESPYHMIDNTSELRTAQSSAKGNILPAVPDPGNDACSLLS